VTAACHAEALIDAARRAESAARKVDPRSRFRDVCVGELRARRLREQCGLRGRVRGGVHALFAEPIARANGGMQRDYWMTPRAASPRSARPKAAPVGAPPGAAPARRAACDTAVPVIFDPLTAASLWGVRGWSAAIRYTAARPICGQARRKRRERRVTLVDDAVAAPARHKPVDGQGLPSRRTR
jgi:predicted Zn-dependent protease